ncbi:MAG: hypothetical protein Q8O67_28260 [Deltaproteobacteria bacterium]|nr:hypothetical protein [Deltaproteobacteria bacterium]
MSPLLLLLLCAAGPDVVVDAGPRPVEVPEVVDAGVVASPFTITARIEPDPVPFGGAVDLVVTVTRPPRRHLTVPDLIEPTETLPRVGDVRREAKELPGDRVQETLRFSFLALDVKELKTPAFAVSIDDVGVDPAGAGAGTPLEVPSLPVRVQVEAIVDNVDGGVPPGTLVVDAAADHLTYRVADERPFIGLVVAVIAVILGLLLRLLLKRKRAIEIARGPPPVPPRPAHEIALERLDALMPLLTQGQVTTFVEKMMDEVLRDYLAGRFALAAGTRTTKEIVGDLLGVVSAHLDVGLIEKVGQDADLVKFARAHLAAEQAHAMAGRVRALIIATAAQKEPTP